MLLFSFSFASSFELSLSSRVLHSSVPLSVPTLYYEYCFWMCFACCLLGLCPCRFLYLLSSSCDLVALCFSDILLSSPLICYLFLIFSLFLPVSVVSSISSPSNTEPNHRRIRPSKEMDGNRTRDRMHCVLVLSFTDCLFLASFVWSLLSTICSRRLSLSGLLLCDPSICQWQALLSDPSRETFQFAQTIYCIASG